MKKTLEKLVVGIGLLTGCASEYDTAQDVRVIVKPENPKDKDNIVAYVSGEKAAYDFYWVRDGVTYKMESGQYTTLNSAFTEPGDVWTVHAFVPMSAWVDTYEVGYASIEVE